MIAVAVAVGLVNGSLIRFGKFTPIAATLTLYIALGGFAFLLRSTQGGYIGLSYQNAVNYTFGPDPGGVHGLRRPDPGAGALPAASTLGLAAARRGFQARMRRAASGSASTARS